MSEERQQVEQIGEKFKTEFQGFADLKTDGLNLTDAENLQRELADLRIRHTGKKSEIANAKKLIGRVAPEERGAFGQFVQSVEREIVAALDEVEANLKQFLSLIHI